MASAYNQRVIAVLQRLKLLRQMQDEKWEAIADERAIATLEGLDFNLTSGKQALQLNLPNIGKAIAHHIDQILTNSDPDKTGIPDLDDLPKADKEKIEALMDLMTVSGVGPKKAIQYYNQGIRSAAQLASVGHVVRRKSGELTHREAIGIKYLSELKKSIPREEVGKFGEAFGDAVNTVNETYKTQLTYMLVGSYRRGAQKMGDIDIILVSQVDGEVGKYWPTLLKSLQDAGWLKETISDGNDKYEGIGYIDEKFPAVRIDANKINTVWEYHYAELYFTGSKEFNIKMRQLAKGKGFTLSNREMLDENGKPVQVMDEADIFRVLEMEYVPPEKRGL